MTTVKMMLLPHAQDLIPPLPPDQIRSGLDLVAAVPANAPIIIAPGGRIAIPTGLTITLPPGTEAQIRPRAGLALHSGVTVLAPAAFDASYRGEIHVILINLGSEPFAVERDAKIALLVIAPVAAVTIEWPVPAEGE